MTSICKMINDKIENWLANYAKLFEENNLEEIINCYAVPSTMSTPEKVVIMKSADEVEQQISEILLLTKQSMLKQAKVLDLVIYPYDDNIFIANCRWQMEDAAGQIFAEFGAVYQLVYSKNEFRILNVTSYYQD